MSDMCFHQEFANQAQQTPDAIAVVCGDIQLTYQEIDKRANQVMHNLQMKQVGSDICVGICIERSPELIIGLLGILKAGGAYVPIDPLYPHERLAFIIEDAQISVILTQQSLFDTISSYPVQAICIDTMEALTPQNASVCHTLSQNLAYVIYTSGSTGRPKGVQIDHRSLSHLIEGQTQVFTVQPGERVLQFASISFDASVFEIFITLAKGATLHLAIQNDLLPGPKLIRLLREQAITIVTFPPSVLAVLPEEELPALSTIISAGESCSAQIVARWSPGRNFFNAYGPTEVTVCATMAKCTDGTHQPPIGKPLANKQIYLLDDDLQSVPAGTPGEIYIGGEGLARGYLRQSDITAERFIPHPFTDKAGLRLYRTGDSARYLVDGSLEFLGRLDYQVKIRGFRIEPEEVEAVLKRHPFVTQAVVLAQEISDSWKRLVAYIIPKSQPGPSIDELRAFIKTWVPEYMIPAIFVRLNAFPLTLNGKVDRRALLALDQIRPDLDEAFVAPRSAEEQLLAGIWANVLGLESVGIHDNFLALGGHSLAIMQIISRVREVFHVDLPFSTLFTAPTVAESLDVIRMLQSTDQSLVACPIRPVPRDGYLPLSFAQQQVWLFQQLTSDNKAYIASASIKIEGDLDIPHLERSINELIKRHEILRTTFPTVDQRPVLKIHDPQPQYVEIVDLQQFSVVEQETEAQRVIYEASSTPFDITRLPLIRWKLLKFNTQKHVLIIVEHHFVHDGWSSNMLLAELRELYIAFLEGKPSPLPELSIQFADFAYWQRQWIQGAEAAKHLAYWKQKLAGSPVLLNLPLDRPRPPLLDLHGATAKIQLSTEQYNALKAFCRREGVTLYMALLAVLLTLLYRYSGQDDICVGASIANRRWREMERVVGMVLNTIVLREKVSDTTIFRELLAQVRETIVEASIHQDFPFESIVEALQPERSLSYNPIYQVMFAYHGAPLPDFEFPNTTMHLFQGHDNGSVKVDINITVVPRPEAHDGWSPRLGSDGMTLLWRYSTALFDESTIARMVGHYQMLLNAVLSGPQQCLAQLPLLTEEERYQQLFVWNETQIDDPNNMPIHRRFERQVDLTPDAVALTFADQQLTYRELNRRANQLAYYLQKKGVCIESRVGICMERSLDLVISLLATLKAGGAYVPLDPDYPAERLAFMLEDAQLIALLTHGQILKKLPDYQILTVCLDDDWGTVIKELMENLPTLVDNHNAAYIIYTSGSTGKPKGVVVEHLQLLNYLNAVLERLALPSEANFALISTLATDLGNTMIFPAICTGGCLHVVPQECVFDPAVLTNYLRFHPIDCLKITPSHLAALLTPDDAKFILPRLRLILGGEASSWDLIEKLQALAPDCTIINHYGPTETTVGVLTYQIETALKNRFAVTVPIGRPLANTQIYLLDDYLQPVPIGVPGEIYIGGMGLSRGYLNHPQLTAEKFIPHPFSVDGGDRLYRTGDLARWKQNGVLEFLGRIDHQVKVRGFRIELGEIEATLREYPSVKNAVVLVREEVSNGKSLVAYIVLTQREGSCNHNELSDFLRERLPEYMVPGSWFLLDELPLLPNGKIDRRALLASDWQRFTVEQVHLAPRTSLEERLEKIWATVLGLEQVGVLENFFNIGGDSLKAIQVMARVQQMEQVQTPLSSLFENPTIAGLASIVMQYKQKNGQQETITPITQNGQAQGLLPTVNQSNIDQFSDEQVTLLLHEILEQGGHLHE